MKTLFRNMAVAFSLYSRIPMPSFPWEKEDTKYAIAFLPWIGLLIGGAWQGLYLLGTKWALPAPAGALLWAALPLIITGGFHLDGFLDVADARRSYKSPEEKREILKDPHIGAFAVISLALYGCLFLAGGTLLWGSENGTPVTLACIGFWQLRALTAYLSVRLIPAKKDGLLQQEIKETGKVTKGIILAELTLGVAVMGCLAPLLMMLTALLLSLFAMWFRRMCTKEFGGVTGDTMGYFLTLGELLWLLLTACYGWFVL